MMMPLELRPSTLIVPGMKPVAPLMAPLLLLRPTAEEAPLIQVECAPTTAMRPFTGDEAAPVFESTPSTDDAALRQLLSELYHPPAVGPPEGESVNPSVLYRV